jgi:hypothetical protein
MAAGMDPCSVRTALHCCRRQPRQLVLLQHPNGRGVEPATMHHAYKTTVVSSHLLWLFEIMHPGGSLHDIPTVEMQSSLYDYLGSCC